MLDAEPVDDRPLPPTEADSPAASRPAVAPLLPGWILACVVLQLLQIGGDGLASAVLQTLPPEGLAAGPTVVLVLLVARLGSSALGGLAQSRVLRSRLPSLRGWVLATGLGSGLALLLVNVLWFAGRLAVPEALLGLLMTSRGTLSPPVAAGLMGLFVGAAQMVVLRRWLRGAAWWVPVSALGSLGAELAIGVAQALLGPMGFPVQRSAVNPLHWLLVAAGAVIHALLTGWFLARRLAPPRPIP